MVRLALSTSPGQRTASSALRTRWSRSSSGKWSVIVTWRSRDTSGLWAGAGAGVGVSFRLTPAFALSVAVAVGALALDRSWRTWLREWGAYAVGVLLVVVPVVAWLGATVGLETAWREIIVRPVVMTDM